MARTLSLSLRNTLIVALVFAALLPLLVVSIYTTMVTEDRLAEEELHDFEHLTLRLSQELSNTLSLYLADLRALERVPPLHGMIRARARSGVDVQSDITELQWRLRLKQIFLGFIEAKPRYHQLRFFDQSGAELLRVARRDAAAVVIDGDGLPVVAKQPFFRRAMAMRSGQYVVADALGTAADRMADKGPLRILRFAVPVMNTDGKSHGVLALEVSAGWLFEWLHSVEGSSLALFDHDGRYLYHPDHNRSWGNLGAHPTALEQQAIVLRNALTESNPYGNWQREDGDRLVFAKVPIGTRESDLQWLLVNTLAPEMIGSAVQPIRTVLVVLFGLSLLTAVGLGYWLSAAWVVRPIDALLGAVRRFGRGELDARAMTFADNEIGRLAKTFNEMAHFHKSSLERERAQAEQLRQSAKVFEYTRDGVTITDREGKILAVNAAFTEITGFSEAEALGRTPRILKSHRHSVEFYREMWDTLLREGQWQGEVWNRRKNGEVFPEWLTITQVEDERGEPSNYVAVFSDISSRKREQERLSHLAHFDILTDLPNRLLFADRVRHALQRAKRDGHQCALLFLDLDDFKPVNDRFGHLAGDQVLQAVAGRFVAALREEDTIARLGGDEFAVLLEAIHSRQDVADVADKLAAALLEPLEVDAVSVRVGVSIGASVYPEDGITFEALLTQADQAMYAAKDTKDDRSVIFGAETRN